MYAFVAYDKVTQTFLAARDPLGIIPLYMGWGNDGSVWFSSELKGLQETCENFESFPPGHYYVGKASGEGQMKPFYKEPWFKDIVRYCGL